MMLKNNDANRKSKKRIISFLFFLIIFIVIVGLPLLFLNYQASVSGMTLGEVIKRKINKSGNNEVISELDMEDISGEKIDFLISQPIGQKYTEAPQISHLQVTDLDNDGLLDVVVCDAKNNFVSWIRQSPVSVFTETVLEDELIAPAHVQVCDFDNDGDKDLMVAVLGMLFPNNDKIGTVVILENNGSSVFSKRIIAEKIARVSDVRAGDLDNDGDLDLAVAQFGYDDGETRWIENLGNWNFQSHILQNMSGPINVEIIDIENDGDLDIISLVSQEWEEIYCFVNDGKGIFQSRLLWGSSNEDFGSSGIFISDIDMDGDNDILYTNGDAFDYIPPVPRPWHGIQWLENQGDMKFVFHRLCNFAGAYNCRPVDIDNDKDLDLFAVSGFNFWDKPESQSFIWLENSGNMKYKRRDIANSPTHLLSLETGDFNNDGFIDFVTGGMNTYPPYDRISRVTLWLNNGFFAAKK